MVLISLVPALTPLYLYVSTFRSMCALPNMAVFCSSLTSWFPGMLLTYFLNNFEMVPVAPIFTGITFVFTFHMRCISIVRSLYYYYYYYYYILHIFSEYDMIYLTAIGLTSGGSSTVHIYTRTIHSTTQFTN